MIPQISDCADIRIVVLSSAAENLCTIMVKNKLQQQGIERPLDFLQQGLVLIVQNFGPVCRCDCEDQEIAVLDLL